MRFAKSLIALTVTTALTACGGSDSSDTNVSNPPPGDDNTGSTTTTVYTEGVITGFGSVYVNGQRYRSENADIALANNPAATEGDLKVGMVVSLAASESNNGDDPEATNIRYEEHLQGPISFIDTEAEVIEILGQRVVYNDLTEFDEVALADLTIGDIIEVSGYINEEGDFYATRIELENDEEEFKLKGDVTALDTSAQTFMINELTIDYSSAEFDDMSAADLEDGLYVKVEGTEFDAETLTLVATDVENKDNNVDDYDDADEIKIAGIVSNYDEATGTFDVNQYSFTVNDDTEFEDGSASRLVNGARVKVEAEYDGEQLVAEEIEFIAKSARNVSEGQVTAVDAEAQSFTVNGITFVVDDDTSYLDTSGQGARTFNYEDIAVNDWLKVIAVIDYNGDYVALKIKRTDEDDRDGEIKGVASDVSLEGMTVAGVQVSFNEQTEFEDEDDLSIDEFVALFSDDTELQVEVEGDYDGDILIASEVEIEREDDEDDDDDNDDGDDDNANDKRGKAEFEGAVESIDGESVIVNGYELRFSSDSELEIDDEEVSLEDFLAALEVGSIIEVEGIWRNQTYIEVKEAEL
ncbi:hypothetical protein DEU29_10295 [Idiomarina aquatica]|uniref:DUF5666 domain-containing protein n=1 Tax=Idiomarina aquatica TaxID=1327752 RepID=A0A4R6PPB2_9GAMM|nr:DUF5666 domain-containing protein [Idiomarina aquatica]TDP40195.1 hypothetical protein DEU29_10295 [Idiomarina aquatica]